MTEPSGLKPFLASMCLRIISSRALTIGVIVAIGGLATAQQPASGEWPNITGGSAGTRYSTLDQITASNFNTLKVAWEWKVDRDAGVNLGGEVNARGWSIRCGPTTLP